MRIIIEVEPGDSQPVIKTEAAAALSQAPQAGDGGPPAAELMEALGDTAEGVSSLWDVEGASPAGDHPQDAGAVPDWLVTSVESDPIQKDS